MLSSFSCPLIWIESHTMGVLQHNSIRLMITTEGQWPWPWRGKNEASLFKEFVAPSVDETKILLDSRDLAPNDHEGPWSRPWPVVLDPVARVSVEAVYKAPPSTKQLSIHFTCPSIHLHNSTQQNGWAPLSFTPALYLVHIDALLLGFLITSDKTSSSCCFFCFYLPTVGCCSCRLQVTQRDCWPY